MYIFYNQGKKKKLFNKTNPLLVKINTKQLKGEGKKRKNNPKTKSKNHQPTRYKNNFPWV
jgi:hypothetical protein